MGCTCGQSRKIETNCSDGADNDGDGKIDCADSDCVGAGTENCTDGIDNDGDRAIDCGDAKCTGNPAVHQPPGRPAPASPTGSARAASATPRRSPATPTACARTPRAAPSAAPRAATAATASGGPRHVCRTKCTGTGPGATGRCRVGYVCVDSDTTPTNNNNVCFPLCTSDPECAGCGTGYGCNPWSKRCEQQGPGPRPVRRGLHLGRSVRDGNLPHRRRLPGRLLRGVLPGRHPQLRQPAASATSTPATATTGAPACKDCASSTECRQSSNYSCWTTSPARPTPSASAAPPARPATPTPTAARAAATTASSTCTCY